MRIKNAFLVFREKGLNYTMKKAFAYIIRQRVGGYADLVKLVDGKSALEIGGPSGIFRSNGYIPLYKYFKSVDGCNFSTHTIWEGRILAGQNYHYAAGKQPGFQYISEAADLHLIQDEKYDVVVSSHCLEHVANPLRALGEWKRVARKNGIIVTIVPNKQFTFDHRRPVTTFDHILQDQLNHTPESDLTHLDEVLELHDLALDKPAGTKENFAIRCRNNAQTRSMHHHVFDLPLLQQMYEHLGLEVLLTSDRTLDMMIAGRKR